MAFGLKLRKLPAAEINQRVEEAAALLGLTAYLDRKPKALSGGQRQRVAVGRAIVRQPQVFLFDEPLSNLDAKMRVSMRTEIAKLHARLGSTMIYVTHDQVEAMTMGTRICVMKDGHIMQVATPLEVYHRPANLFVANFIGSPPMNLIEGRIEQRAPDNFVFVEKDDRAKGLCIALPTSLHALAQKQRERPTTLGIRPEHITLVAQNDKSATFTLPLEFSEPLGAETYLHLNTVHHPLIARINTDSKIARGSSVTVHFDLQQLHLFDSETTQRLDPQRA